MHVVRSGEGAEYTAVAHHGVRAFRLHGRDVTPAPNFWVGLSEFAPDGGAEEGASPTEKVYLVLAGEITVITKDGETTLKAWDSCLLSPNEVRSIENRSGETTRMLVISPS